MSRGAPSRAEQESVVTSQLSVAFIGCGKRAREHAKGVKADARCKVVALADVNAAAAEGIRTDFGFGGEVYTDHLRMLRDVRPDVVVTSLWTPLHLPIFRDCVHAGVKAVLSEKPMAPTWGECLEMGRLADESKVQLTFSHQRRFATGNRLVRQLIGEGTFGKVERMDLYSPQNLLDCGTHTIDQAMSFLNETPAKWALGAVDVSSLINWFNVRAECMSVGTIVFANGVRATIQTGGPDMDLWSGVRVTGSGGFVEVLWDRQIKRAVVYKEPTWTFPTFKEDTGDDHMVAMVKDAIDCLQTGRESDVSYRKALRVTETIFALYESVRRRARVELPLIGVTDSPFLTMLEQGAFGPIKDAN